MLTTLAVIGILVGIILILYFFIKLLIIEGHPEVIGIAIGVLIIILSLNCG
jgi:hypothetical protein